jgi:hypothetical protein
MVPITTHIEFLLPLFNEQLAILQETATTALVVSGMPPFSGPLCA